MADDAQLADRCGKRQCSRREITSWLRRGVDLPPRAEAGASARLAQTNTVKVSAITLPRPDQSFTLGGGYRQNRGDPPDPPAVGHGKATLLSWDIHRSGIRRQSG